MAGNVSTGNRTAVSAWHGVPGAEVISGLTPLRGGEGFDGQLIYRLEVRRNAAAVGPQAAPP
eukprot:6672444-Prymnesium_polylepis.1